MPFKKVTIVGVGLLGGSLGLALRRQRLAKKVAGFVRRPASLAECEISGAVDFATLDLNSAVEGADLIVLCTPLAQMSPLVEKMLPCVEAGAVITDVGSVKTEVVRALSPRIAKAGAHFIGSHPMAGAEKTGVSAAHADLFSNAVCVVTPTKNANAGALRAVEQLWRSVGSRVIRLSPEIHDSLVSRSSHLSHVTAAALANLVLDPASPRRQAELCANGFRDTTRIASGSPEMWRDIAMQNRRNLGRALASFIRELEKFRRALNANDAEKITRFFEQAKARRDRWRSRCASPSPE